MAYKLSKELIGHEKDVRFCCSYVDERGEEKIITCGRDKRIIVWKLTSLGSYEPQKIISSHDNYVNCLCVIPADLALKRDEILLASGSADRTIHIHSLKPEVSEPLKRFTGHEDSVVGLIFVSGTVISVSWDGKLCVWTEVPIFQQAHSPSAQCIAAVEESGDGFTGAEGASFLTGGADQSVKLWCWQGNEVKMMKMYSGHTSTVRDIKVLSKYLFFSVSNDQTLKQWSMQTEECLKSILCHDAYAYSLSLFPGSIDSLVTSGEDRSVKVWKGGEITQCIEFPTQSVWSVHCLTSGNFVAGSSDGKARVFTADPTGFAHDVDLEKFEQGAVTFKTKTGQPLDPAKFPGPEALKSSGKQKHGDTQVINNKGQLEVYQWNSATSEWELIGHASGQKLSEDEPEHLPNGKWLYQGKEYDYVIPTEIDEDFGKGKKLHLPYNKSTDPWIAAQQFLDTNHLPVSQLEQVANHIQKIAGPYSYKGNSGAGGGFNDPFTGSSRYLPGGGGEGEKFSATQYDPYTGGVRYIPGTQGSNVPKLGGGTGFTSDPLTGGARYVPPSDETTMGPKVTFTQGKSDNQPPLIAPNNHFPMLTYRIIGSPAPTYGDKVVAKLTEFNAALPSFEGLSVSELMELAVISTALSENPPAEQFTRGHCHLLARMLHWPVEMAFPVLDLVRLALLHPVGSEFFAQEEILDKLIVFTLSTGAGNKNLPVALRCLVNYFAHPLGIVLMIEHKQKVVSVLDAQCEAASANRTVQIAVATVVLNYHHYYFENSRDFEDLFSFLKYSTMILRSSCFDPEAKFRALVAIGTMVSIGKSMVEALRSNNIKAIIQSLEIPESAASGKIHECADIICKQL